MVLFEKNTLENFSGSGDQRRSMADGGSDGQQQKVVVHQRRGKKLQQ